MCSEQTAVGSHLRSSAHATTIPPPRQASPGRKRNILDGSFESKEGVTLRPTPPAASHHPCECLFPSPRRFAPSPLPVSDGARGPGRCGAPRRALCHVRAVNARARSSTRNRPPKQSAPAWKRGAGRVRNRALPSKTAAHASRFGAHASKSGARASSLGAGTSRNGARAVRFGADAVKNGAGAVRFGADAVRHGASATLDRSCATFDRSCATFDRSCATFDRSCATFDRSRAAFDRSCATFDRSCATFDRSRAALDLLPPTSPPRPLSPSPDGARGPTFAGVLRAVAPTHPRAPALCLHTHSE